MLVWINTPRKAITLSLTKEDFSAAGTKQEMHFPLAVLKGGTSCTTRAAAATGYLRHSKLHLLRSLSTSSMESISWPRLWFLHPP